jgi:hypothetical protein
LSCRSIEASRLPEKEGRGREGEGEGGGETIKKRSKKEKGLFDMPMSEEEILQCTISILLGNIKFNYYKIFMYHPIFYVLL